MCTSDDLNVLARYSIQINQSFPFYFSLILLLMSKYKTPFINEVESSKALQNRTSKYRLPFQKDEPAEDLQKSLNNLSQHNISLQSDIKLPKLAISTELNKIHPPRKHKNIMGIHEEVNLSVKSDR